MPILRDANRDLWAVNIDRAAARRIKGVLRINVGAVDLTTWLRRDPLLAVEVLYVLLGDEIKRRGMSPRQFAQSLRRGEALNRAITTLIKAQYEFVKG